MLPDELSGVPVRAERSCDYIVASTYGQTAFDQAVGWSRWLMLNHHEPSMWSKSGFEEELDDDDL